MIDSLHDREKGGIMKIGKILLTVLMSAVLVINTRICYPVSGIMLTQQDTTIPSGKTITITQAKSLGLSNSSDYSSLQSKLALAQVRYSQSVKSLQLKKKNQSTFRWTPLLNFKFPEDPTLKEEVEYTYKPLELQSDIDVLKHQILDNRYAVYEEITLLYVECYTLQEKITFYETRLNTLQETQEKNQARLAIGQATQNDVDKIGSDVEKVQTQLLGDMRNYETAKDKLSDAMGLDVRSGYTFMNPYISAEITRDDIEGILNDTYERDQGYYEAQVNTSNALLELNTNNQLMSNQYGTNMNLINSFVQQVLNGEDVDQAAFRLKYDEFLQKIDAPWQGKFKILFIKIPKEWKKGEVDGIRYVEDEPYALYEAALNYKDVYDEEQQVKKALETSVTDSFNNYISVRTTYESVRAQVAEAQETLQKDTAKNLMGQFSYEELADEQTEYADLQMEELEALSDYTKTLASFDRLTCGAISDRLEAQDSGSTDVMGGGVSYVVEEEEEGAYYYIHSLASDNAFEFGLYIPEKLGVTITAYELWVNGTQIGDRTDISRSIKHLALSIDSVDSAFVRLYNQDTVVDDCEIDTSVYSGKLVITTGYQIKSDESRVIGTYTLNTSAVTGAASLEIQTDKAEIQYYDIRTADGMYLANREKISIRTGFKYLGLISSDIPNLTFCFYGSDRQLLYECRADAESRQLVEKKVE